MTKRMSLAERLTPDRYAVEDRGFTSPCWIWLGAKDQFGYGVISVRRGTPSVSYHIGIHRVSYEIHVGPIPPTFHVHHECRQTPCLNPAHLQLLSRAEHARITRGTKTHCLRGHEFTPENTHVAKDGRRRCRACDAARRREHRAREASMKQARRTMSAFNERASNFDEFALGQYLRDEAREESKQDCGRQREDELEARADARDRSGWTPLEAA
jgi:hypothetical protein